MEYKTKFGLGDTVFYGNTKEIHKSTVIEIKLSKYGKSNLLVLYELSDKNSFEESYLMTKEEAIKYLWKRRLKIFVNLKQSL